MMYMNKCSRGTWNFPSLGQGRVSSFLLNLDLQFLLTKSWGLQVMQSVDVVLQVFLEPCRTQGPCQKRKVTLKKAGFGREKR